MESSDLPLVKTLAVKLGFGGVYAEELCLIAGVDKKEIISEQLSEKIFDAIKLLVNKSLEPALVMEGEKIRIGIIGLGLMGGSAGLRLKEQSIASTVFGCDIIPKNCAEALTLGLVDEIVDLEQLSQNADLIIMAIPVNKALELLPLIMANVHPDAVVIDFGSTKKRISSSLSSIKCEAARLRLRSIKASPFMGINVKLCFFWAYKFIT